MAYNRRYELHFPDATRIVVVTTRPASTCVRFDACIDADELPDEFFISTVGGIPCGMIVPTVLMHATTITAEPTPTGLAVVVLQTPISNR